MYNERNPIGTEVGSFQICGISAACIPPAANPQRRRADPAPTQSHIISTPRRPKPREGTPRAIPYATVGPSRRLPSKNVKWSETTNSHFDVHDVSIANRDSVHLENLLGDALGPTHEHRLTSIPAFTRREAHAFGGLTLLVEGCDNRAGADARETASGAGMPSEPLRLRG